MREFGKEERKEKRVLGKVLEKCRCIDKEKVVRKIEKEQPGGREKTRRIFYCWTQEERFQEGSCPPCQILLDDLEAESRKGPSYWQDRSHCTPSTSDLVGFGCRRELEGFKSEQKVRWQMETVSAHNSCKKLWRGQREEWDLEQGCELKGVLKISGIAPERKLIWAEDWVTYSNYSDA